MILEICQLKIKPILSPSDPSLLAALIKARTELREKVYNTNSRFYQCIEDPTLIYILGVWPSLERHHEFLKSPQKSEILDSQEDLFDFGWVLHLEIGDDGMEELPLGAPTMSVARLFIKNSEEHVKGYDDAVEKYRRAVVEGAKPWKVVDGWRVDCEEGRREAIMLSGWDGIEAHQEFTARTREKYPEYAGVREHYEGIDIKHARDMEV